MPRIRLDQVNLVVRDVRAGRGFYDRLGRDFGEQRDPATPSEPPSAT